MNYIYYCYDDDENIYMNLVTWRYFGQGFDVEKCQSYSSFRTLENKKKDILFLFIYLFI